MHPEVMLFTFNFLIILSLSTLVPFHLRRTWAGFSLIFMFLLLHSVSQDSCQYSDNAMGWMTGVQFLAGAGIFSLCHCVHTGSGAHPASFPMGTSDTFPHLRLRMCAAIPPLPHSSSWYGA